jgi:hypothetical protein
MPVSPPRTAAYGRTIAESRRVGRRRPARLPVHDLRHTVVTDLLEAGEPERAIQAVTSKKMLEHYAHQRLKAKGQMLAGMEVRRQKGTALRISTQRRYGGSVRLVAQICPRWNPLTSWMRQIEHFQRAA